MACVSVEVDLSDYLDELSEKDLLDELKRRQFKKFRDQPAGYNIPVFLPSLEALRDAIVERSWSAALLIIDELRDAANEKRGRELRIRYDAACKNRDPKTKQPVVQ